MLKSRISAIASAVVLTLGTMGAAQAFTISAGDYKIIFDNYDSGTTYGSATSPTPLCGSLSGTAADVTACDTYASLNGAPAPGSQAPSVANPSADSMGIFSIASITKISNGQSMFTRGADGYLTGVFGNLTDFFVQNTALFGGAIQTSTLSKGGTLSVWYNATTDWDPTCSGSSTAPTACGDLSAGTTGTYSPSITPPGGTGSLYLEGVFVNGSAFAGNGTASYFSQFNAATITGSGTGFLNFTGGSALATFDTNGTVDNNGNLVDAKLTTTYSATLPNGSPVGNGWTVFSSSDVTGSAIPEPGSLALVSLALLGLGAAARRARKN